MFLEVFPTAQHIEAVVQRGPRLKFMLWLNLVMCRVSKVLLISKVCRSYGECLRLGTVRGKERLGEGAA